MKSYEDFKREVEEGPISNSAPWEGKTTRSPLGDLERLLPDFIDDQEAVDAFVQYTLRRLVAQHVPKEKAVELMREVFERLQERGEI